MCGIAGIIEYSKNKTETKILDNIKKDLHHRGPDNSDIYVYENISLIHTRLAIIDPSPESNQPFVSNCGRYVIVYNGMIYNYKEIKKELEKKNYKFRTKSDTEVLLNAYIEWKEEALNRFNGLFAFAVLDKEKNKLFLARDRYGTKPLYYYFNNNIFMFGSELKVFNKHPLFEKELDPFALKEYFCFQNVFSDRTLLKNVRLLSSGHYCEINAAEKEINIQKFWDFDFSNKLRIDYEEAVEELSRLLNNAVKRQLISDVPLGSYLSGGMDSSSLAALASRQIPDIPTFTGGFYMEGVEGREAEFDERKKAEYISNYFGLQNYQVIMNSNTMLSVIEDLVYYNDDLRVGQCWQNYTVAHLASGFVKVVLCGAGGDELFGGYPWRYEIADSSKNLEDFNEKYFNYWQRMVPENGMDSFFTSPVYDKIKNYSLREAYDNVFSSHRGDFESLHDRIFYFELKTFMQGLLLVEDKLSMAHGLETRVPFLDNDLADFIIKLPYRHKIDRQGTYKGKRILKDALRGILPDKVLDYKKQGFSPPDENWYRKETAGYLKEQLLEDDSLFYEFINKNYVEKTLKEHIGGGKNNRLLVWSLLNFKFWMNNNL